MSEEHARRPDPDRAPIFVVGSGRSGTTLLRLMLNAHPRIYLVQESAFYAVLAQLKRSGSGSEMLDGYFLSQPFAWLGLDPNEVLAELPHPLPRERLGDVQRIIMRILAQRHRDKPRYGDKTPANSFHLEEIFEDFPEARVVHITRDPRSTVASLMRMPWSPASYTLGNWYYRVHLRAIEPFRDRIHEVRLEDLLQRPREEMEKILAFVGEPWDDAILDHSSHVSLDDVPPFPWLAPATRRLEQPRDSSKFSLPPAWVRLVERVNGRGMRLYGYERARLDPEPRPLARLGAALGDLPHVLAFLWRYLPMHLRRRAGKRVPAAEVQRVAYGLNPKGWNNFPGPPPPPPPQWKPTVERLPTGAARWVRVPSKTDAERQAAGR